MPHTRGVICMNILCGPLHVWIVHKVDLYKLCSAGYARSNMGQQTTPICAIYIYSVTWHMCSIRIRFTARSTYAYMHGFEIIITCVSCQDKRSKAIKVEKYALTVHNNIHMQLFSPNVWQQKNIHIYKYTPCFKKKQPLEFLVITSANENLFSKFFHCHFPHEYLCICIW